jgi:hypothetical protein
MQSLKKSLSTAFASALAAAAIASIPTPAAAFFVPAPCDTITSSGTIANADGTTASFAATGGCKNGQFWGSLSFTDESSGFSFTSTEISGYLWDPADPTAREVCGLAVNQDGEDVFFRARLTDLGEPGRDDTFGLAVDNQDTAGERFFIFPAAPLAEGNVKLHKTNRSTTIDPALGAATEFQMCGDLNSPQ